MESQICKDYSGEPVSINQCYTTFQILGIGAFIAISGFVFEMFLRPKLMKTIDHVQKENVEKLIRLDKRKVVVKDNVERQGVGKMRKPAKAKNNKRKNVTEQNDRIIALHKMIDELQKQNRRLKLKILNKN